MESVAQVILDTLAANGGVISWDVMLAAVPQEGRRFIWEALNHLQATNQAKPQNRYDAENQQAVFEIVTLGG